MLSRVNVSIRLVAFLIETTCFSERTQLTPSGVGVGRIETDLDQLSPAIWMSNQEINFVTLLGTNVGDFQSAPLKLHKDSCSKAMADVRPSGSIEYRNQPGIDGVRLARIDHALPFRCGIHPDRVHQEAVL